MKLFKKILSLLSIIAASLTINTFQAMEIPPYFYGAAQQYSYADESSQLKIRNQIKKYLEGLNLFEQKEAFLKILSFFSCSEEKYLNSILEKIYFDTPPNTLLVAIFKNSCPNPSLQDIILVSKIPIFIDDPENYLDPLPTACSLFKDYIDMSKKQFISDIIGCLKPNVKINELNFINLAENYIVQPLDWQPSPLTLS